jgi:hypothetical protein
MQQEVSVRERLPVHSRPDAKALQNHVLRIDGLVEKCLALTLADLKSLPQEDLIDDFTCREGWSVPNLRWSGVLLEAVFLLARPHPFDADRLSTPMDGETPSMVLAASTICDRWCFRLLAHRATCGILRQ